MKQDTSVPTLGDTTFSSSAWKSKMNNHSQFKVEIRTDIAVL